MNTHPRCKTVAKCYAGHTPSKFSFPEATPLHHHSTLWGMQQTPSSLDPSQRQQQQQPVQQRPDSASRRLEALQQRHAELLSQVETAAKSKQQVMGLALS